ncbi:MAG: GNAT family N-acetyltransferase [Candidatus Heimdallarchaeota archaeon]|nr:GNAT family N-acetyltransferase [Candidatus Heimdallarchaeota archaeon]
MVIIQFETPSDINFHNLALVTYESEQTSHLNRSSVEHVDQAIRLLEARYPSESIITAYIEEKLVGWLGLKKLSKTTSELGRWHPFVIRVDDEHTIGMTLIQNAMDKSKSLGFSRMEAVLNAVNDDAILEKVSTWYKACGFQIVEELCYMTKNLNNIVYKKEHIEEYFIEYLTNAQTDELYECWLRSFTRGQDRDMLDKINAGKAEETFEKTFSSNRAILEDASIVLRWNNKLVGISLVLQREDEGHVDVLVIDPDHWRNGLGRMLLAESVNRIAKAGMSIASIGVDSSNIPAINLYEKLGFEIQSRAVIYSKSL